MQYRLLRDLYRTKLSSFMQKKRKTFLRNDIHTSTVNYMFYSGYRQYSLPIALIIQTLMNWSPGSIGDKNIPLTHICNLIICSEYYNRALPLPPLHFYCISIYHAVSTPKSLTLLVQYVHIVPQPLCRHPNWPTLPPLKAAQSLLRLWWTFF